jgi:hypothetical protein
MLAGRRTTMPGTVDVLIPVDAETASRLSDPAAREAAGRLLSRVYARPAVDELEAAIADLKREAREAGLTDADIDEELAAYNAERRGGDSD